MKNTNTEEQFGKSLERAIPPVDSQESPVVDSESPGVTQALDTIRKRLGGIAEDTETK